MLCTFAFMGFLGFGSRSYATKGFLPDQRLSLDLSECPNTNVTSPTTPPVYWKDREYSGLATFYSISDLWYPAIGCIMVVFLGLLFSFIVAAFSKEKPNRMQARLFVPLVLRMWVFFFPGEMERLVTFDEIEPSGKN